MIIRNIATAASVVALLAGCASHTHEIAAASVSTMGYKGLTCPELEAEMRGSINRVTDLGNVIESKATTDEVQMAVGVILFWPVLFALEGGDGPEAAEYSRLRGEINAMDQVAALNECDGVKVLAQDYHQKEADARSRLKAQREDNNPVMN